MRARAGVRCRSVSWAQGGRSGGAGGGGSGARSLAQGRSRPLRHGRDDRRHPAADQQAAEPQRRLRAAQQLPGDRRGQPADGGGGPRPLHHLRDPRQGEPARERGGGVGLSCHPRLAGVAVTGSRRRVLQDQCHGCCGAGRWGAVAEPQWTLHPRPGVDNIVTGSW